MKRWKRYKVACLLLGLTVLGCVHSEASPVMVTFERFKDESPLQVGGQLLSELQCVQCHAAPQGWDAQFLPKAKLSLRGVGSRLEQDDLQSFLEDPHAFKPGTLMPKVSSLQEDERQALVHFLSSLRSETPKFELGDPALGQELFHTTGCVACHEPESRETYRPKESLAGSAPKDASYPSVPLKLGKHYAYDTLVAFLLNPLEVRPSGRMPHFEMTKEEAQHVAAYLQKGREPTGVTEFNASSELVTQGRELFRRHGCVACHDTGHESAQMEAPALITLNVEAGCLSTHPKSFDYQLSSEQRLSMQAALKALQSGQLLKEQTPAQKVDAYFTTMNCYACHEQQGKGGMDEAKESYFTVYKPAAHSLGEIGMLPPKLDQTGRKLTVAWLEKLLWGEGGGVRPYMTARMPRFGKSNVEGLIPAWVEASKKEPETQIDTTGLLRHQRSEYGRQLLGTSQGGLGCISCHGLKDRDSLGVPVIDLTHTVERLRPEYFKDLLLDPQKLQPGTLMPPLFMGRKKADLEVEQIWTYLKEVDQFRLPDGLVKEGDYQLKPEKVGRPVVFRTFLEGAGTQAIAVGYPNGMNVAFDAYEVRWTLAWKGPFLDAMSTWEERQMTPAKPLGKELKWLPEALPFALSQNPTVVPTKFGQEYGYRFKGYRLDAHGVPTLLYRVGEFTVEDCLKPTEAGDFLRTLKVSGPANQELWYRGGDATETKPVSVRDGSVIEERLKF